VLFGWSGSRRVPLSRRPVPGGQQTDPRTAACPSGSNSHRLGYRPSCWRCRLTPPPPAPGRRVPCALCRVPCALRRRAALGPCARHGARPVQVGCTRGANSTTATLRRLRRTPSPAPAARSLTRPTVVAEGLVQRCAPGCGHRSPHTPLSHPRRVLEPRDRRCKRSWSRRRVGTGRRRRTSSPAYASKARRRALCAESSSLETTGAERQTRTDSRAA
jgi:hypothetical protein